MQRTLLSTFLLCACGAPGSDVDVDSDSDYTVDSDALGGDSEVEDSDTPPGDTDIAQDDRMLLFVTPNDYTRNFDELGGTPGDGLAGADALCNAAASASALGGTYTAWLSTRTVDARDRLAEAGPWYAVGRGIFRTGAMLFRNKAALLGAPLEEIDVASDGSVLRGRVWTATSTGGLFSGSDCGEWGANNEFVGDRRAVAGDSIDRLRWTDDGLIECGAQALLYCFQVTK